ncbi:hypothetical protein [Altericroceibacterium endophyticum]|uniref:Uncharacterized protein n=1 Tax=Altericroceibacterium endophyticum TaxID=1808508 RepID=A0A6I4T2H3_9SPHN|nr:hypothetical protein [Altericroceibacterium endophyticum]MXO65424.1 hypothetical protein [Altericroceibacterium endophyticum]
MVHFLRNSSAALAAALMALGLFIPAIIVPGAPASATSSVLITATLA